MSEEDWTDQEVRKTKRRKLEHDQLPSVGFQEAGDLPERLDEVPIAMVLVRVQNAQYLVKFKGWSHLWSKVVPEELVLRDPILKGRLQKFLGNNPLVLDPQEALATIEKLRTIDRILACNPHSSDEQESAYLVKWIDLGYAESTWEFRRNLDALSAGGKEFVQTKIDGFLQRNVLNCSRSQELGSFYKFEETPDALRHPTHKLHSWQLEGLNWILFNFVSGRGCILADEVSIVLALLTDVLLDGFRKDLAEYRSFSMLAQIP
jgi:hypothetical protein